jgi:hypothetical protein
MNFKQKLELVTLINSHASWQGMYKEKLHTEGSKPEDYEFAKQMRDEKLEKIMEIIEKL